MNRDMADKWCERGILGLVLGILVFAPLALGAVGTVAFLVVQVMVMGVMLLWGVRLWVGERAKLLWPPISWAVLAFALYAIGRYATADIEYLARQEMIRVLVYTFLFFAVLNNLHRQETTTVVALTLIFLGMCTAAYAVYQFATGSDYVWNLVKPYPKRGSGTYICPNHLGGLLEMLFPLALAYTVLGRMKPVLRVVVGYAALVIVAGIVATVSRGTWLGTAAALFLLFGILAFLRRYRIPALALLGLLLVAGVVFMPRQFAFRQRALKLTTTEGRVDDDLRFSMWAPAFRMWRDHPWWGIGPAHFDARFPQYRPEQVQLRPLRAHNDYLNTLADWGLAGAGLVAAAWALAAAGVLKTWGHVRRADTDLGRKRGSNKLAFVLGASAGLVAILCHSVVDFNMHIPANAMVAVTLLALLSGHLRFATEAHWVGARAWMKTAICVALAAGMAYFALKGAQAAHEHAWLTRARRAQAFSTAQVELLKRANLADSQNYETAYRIGEALRRQSQEGGETYDGIEGVNYGVLAGEAMEWFKRAMELNPWHHQSRLGYGWTLDWLGRKEEAAQYFETARRLDPNGYYTMNYIGLHHVEAGNLAAARMLFERSLRLEWTANDTARNYLQIIDNRLLESAEDPLRARLREAIAAP